MTKAQKACWRVALGVEESNVMFLFSEKKTLGHYFSPHLSIWSGSVQGPGCKASPYPCFAGQPSWCHQNNRSDLLRWIDQLVASWKNGKVRQAGGEKHPLKTPWGVQAWFNLGGWAKFLCPRFSPALLWSHRAGAAHLKSPFHKENLAPRANVLSPRGNGNACLHHFVFPTKRYNGNGEFIPPHLFFLFF